MKREEWEWAGKRIRVGTPETVYWGKGQTAIPAEDESGHLSEKDAQLRVPLVSEAGRLLG